MPKPKQRNAFLRLYDLPLHRDWAAWLTLAMLVITPIALGTGQKTDSTPRWVDIVAGTPTFVILFGVIPAAARLWFRRFRWKRSGGSRSSDHASFSQIRGLASSQPPSQGEMSPSVDAAATSDSEAAVPRRAQPRAVPIGVLQRSDLGESEVLGTARRILQYPIARGARSIQLAGDRREEYEAILRTCEATAVTIGVSIVAAMRTATADLPAAFSELQTAYRTRGVAQGHWLSVIAATDRLVKGQGEPLTGLADALRLGPKGTGLVADLRTVLEERNRWAHGAGPRTFAEASERIDEMAPILERVLDRSMFLEHSPWVLVRASAYRRSRGDFDILAADAMGDHPDFERRDFTSDVPLANDTFYMIADAGTIDLTPLVVMRDCPECHQAELCHADRVDKRAGVALKSFARGHVMFDPTLVAEVNDLFRPTGGTAELPASGVP